LPEQGFRLKAPASLHNDGLEAAWILASTAACLKVAVFIGLQADSAFFGFRAALACSTVTKNLVTVIAHVVDRSLQLALALKASLIGYRTRQATQFKTVSLQPRANDRQTVLADARRPLDHPTIQPGHFLRRNHRL